MRHRKPNLYGEVNHVKQQQKNRGYKQRTNPIEGTPSVCAEEWGVLKQGTHGDREVIVHVMSKSILMDEEKEKRDKEDLELIRSLQRMSSVFVFNGQLLGVT